MWNPPGRSSPPLQPRGAPHSYTYLATSPQPPSPSQKVPSGTAPGRRGGGSELSRASPSSTASVTTTTSPMWRASNITDRSPLISSPTGNIPSLRSGASSGGFTGNVHTDPVQPIPTVGSPRSTSPPYNTTGSQVDGGDGGDTRSSTSRSRGFNRLFSALGDAASQSAPRGSPVAATTSSSGSDSSSSRSLSGGSMPHAPHDAMSSHASQRGGGGGSIQNESIYSGVSMPASMPAIKESTDLLSKFASRMVSNQWRATTATLGGNTSASGGRTAPSITVPPSSFRDATEAAHSNLATSPTVSGRGAIVFTDSPHPNTNATSYTHRVGGTHHHYDHGEAGAASSSAKREWGFGMEGFGDGGSGRGGGSLGSVGNLGCSSRSDHDDDASVQHSTFTLNSQLTGGGPSLMHSAMGSAHTVSTSAGGVLSMHSNASKGSRPWTIRHNGTDDIMTNAFGAKVQRNALLYAIVDENARTQSRSDPLNTGSMTPGRASKGTSGDVAGSNNHWSPPASMSFGSPPANPADMLQGVSNTNNLSTTASPEAKLSRPTPTRAIQFANQSSTEPIIYVDNIPHKGGHSLASLSHTAPLATKNDRSQLSLFSPSGVFDGDNDEHQQSGVGVDRRSVMTSFVSGNHITNKATPIEAPPLVPSPPRDPNHSRSLSASRSSDIERCEVTGERRADLPPAPPQGARKGFPPGRPEPLHHPVNTVIPHAPRMIKVPDEDGRNKRKMLRYRPPPRSGPACLAKFIDSDTVSEEQSKAQSDLQEAIGAHQCWPGSNHQDEPQLVAKFASSNDTTQLDYTFTTVNTPSGGNTRNGPTSCETTFLSFGTGLTSRSPQSGRSGSSRPVTLLGSGRGSNRLGFDMEDSNMGGTMTTFGTTAPPRAQHHQLNVPLGSGRGVDPSGGNSSLSNGDLSSMGVGGDDDGGASEEGEGVMGGWGEEGGALPTPSSRNPMLMHHHHHNGGMPLSSSSNATNATTFGTDPNGTRSDPTKSGGTGSDDVIRSGSQYPPPAGKVPGVVSLQPPAAASRHSKKGGNNSSLSDEYFDDMKSGSGGVGVLGDFASLPVPVKGHDTPVAENFPLETTASPAPRRLNAPWTKVNVDRRSSKTASTPPPTTVVPQTAPSSYRMGGGIVGVLSDADDDSDHMGNVESDRLVLQYAVGADKGLGGGDSTNHSRLHRQQTHSISSPTGSIASGGGDVPREDRRMFQGFFGRRQ